MATTACANCGAPLAGEYCARCGQRAVRTNPTLSEFLHETTHELLHWDGKIPRTLKALFFQPGRLTIDFLAGRRARWLSPLRVYLICSLVFFASRPIMEAITGRSFRQIAQVTFRNPSGLDGQLSAEDRERVTNSPLSRFISVQQLERVAANPDRMNREFDAAHPRAMLLLLPVFALLTNLTWRRTQPRYPTHLYVALHLNALAFGVLTWLGIVVAVIGSESIVPFVGFLALTYIVWYNLVSFRRVFGESWPKTIAKSILVGMAYFICLAITGFVLLAYAISRM